MNKEQLFLSLVGSWQFERSLTSHNDNQPSGVVCGMASFKRVSETTLHYFEQGHFTTNSQQTFSVTQRYAYCLLEDGAMCKYFLETDDRLRLFYPLEFLLKEGGALTAKGQHLCGKDEYQASYLFPEADNVSHFELGYWVKGPAKDYVSSTHYTANSD